jgi:hypothetical protein
VVQEELYTLQDVITAADILTSGNELQQKLRAQGVTLGCILTVKRDIQGRIEL